MIEGDEVGLLVEDFAKRGVKLYHACQLKDFRTYLQAGGVPSRKVLEATGAYTAFDTDRQDKINGVWDKVFFNISDFGGTFATGYTGGDTKRPTSATPNAFGPILLVLSPDALTTAEDVAICLRSAGGQEFDRQADSLDLDQVGELFQGGTGSREASWQRKKAEIQTALRLDYSPSHPEISCSISDGVANLQYVKEVVVDPIHVGDRSLLELVSEAMARRGGPTPRSRSWIHASRTSVYNELTQIIAALSDRDLDRLRNNADAVLQEIANGVGASDALQEWAKACRSANLGWMFGRYACYLRRGTIGA